MRPDFPRGIRENQAANHPGEIKAATRAGGPDEFADPALSQLLVIRIATADADFDGVPGIIRLNPADDTEWKPA